MTEAAQTLSYDDIYLTAAEDSEYFHKEFFPKTFRQPSAEMHAEVDEVLEGPDRYVALKMFRGSSKTTRLRAFAAKRISYGISRTIGFVGNAQKNAIYSVRWLKRQVEYNRKWRDFYGLRPAEPWSNEHICIYSELHDHYINVIALGITSGGLRGINLDDYRLDLVIGDDIDNEESTNTPDQREKTSDIMGSLEKGLTPPTEDLNAKMVILQTPINDFDYITVISKSSKWKTATFGCFDETGNSRWEVRYPTEWLKAEKQSHVELKKLHLWMREMECVITSKETNSFDVDWLRFWDKEGHGEFPPSLDTIIAIDPASSEEKGADDQVIGAIGFKGPDIYILDYTAETGEMPDAAAHTFFTLIRRFHPRKAAVETISYQRVLKWYLEKEMRKRRMFLVTEAIQDKRKKGDRIVQELAGPAAYGHLYCKSTHEKFIQQFTEYSPIKDMHDDVLDMVSIACCARKISPTGETLEGEYKRIAEEEEDIPELEEWRVPI